MLAIRERQEVGGVINRHPPPVAVSADMAGALLPTMPNKVEFVNVTVNRFVLVPNPSAAGESRMMLIELGNAPAPSNTWAPTNPPKPVVTGCKCAGGHGQVCVLHVLQVGGNSSRHGQIRKIDRGICAKRSACGCTEIRFGSAAVQMKEISTGATLPKTGRSWPALARAVVAGPNTAPVAYDGARNTKRLSRLEENLTVIT